MRHALIAAAAAFSLSTLAGAAFAQAVVPPGTPSSAVQPDPGVTSEAAVDPAPGAPGPYVGHGPNAFYDVDARIDRMTQRVSAMPAGGARSRAMAALRSIRAEEATQKARHGELRDWDRENLNHRLDQLQQGMPAA